MTKPTKSESFAARSLRANLVKQRRGPTLLEHAVIKAGIIQGPEALWNLVMWTIARRKNGHEPSWEEFAEVACSTRAPAYKALKGLVDVYGDQLPTFADTIEAEKAKQLDTLLGRGAGRSKDASGVAGLIGPVPAPAGYHL
jgi:hypothetical protein